MASTRSRSRPSLEWLERRLAMSLAPAPGVGPPLAVDGEVERPGQVARVDVPVDPERFPQRRSIIYGVTVRPTSEGGLDPAIVAASGTAGETLPIRRGAPFRPGRIGAARAYLRDGDPGPFSVAVAGRHATAGPFQLGVDLPGDADGDGRVTLADQQRYVASFPSRAGDEDYDPAVDFSRNGVVGQGDGRLLLRNLATTPAGPLQLELALAPEDQARGETPQTSGGATHNRTVTILGRTTPGSIVFADSGLGDYSFAGSALATDAAGNFSLTVVNMSGSNTYNFLAIDPRGQQVIRSFPVYWIDYGRYADAHPGTTSANSPD